MGQYYKPINLDTNGNLYTHDYDNGSKLMEHSFLTNNFVEVIETLLMPNHKWHKNRIVWAGDYADPELDEQGNPLTKKRIDHRGLEYTTDLNLYSLAVNENTLKPREVKVPKEFKYIVNHTKKEYINKDSVPDISWERGLKIHPLPLLTCEGNGRGGGDYYDESELIGRWSRDVISVEKVCPRKHKKLNFDLTEESRG